MAADSVRCGARNANTGRPCRYWALKKPTARGKRRCKFHGGMSISRTWNTTGRKYQWAGSLRKQALLRALGLPWYGGAPKKKVTLTMAEKAIQVLDEVVDQLPAPRDVPDSEKGDLEIFGEGVRASCILLRDTVYLGQRVMLDPETGERLTSVAAMHPQDLKLLGMAQITALGVTKQGFKAADRAQRNDIIGQLLAQIAAEQKAGGKQ